MEDERNVHSMEPTVTTATARNADGEVIFTFPVLRTPLRDLVLVEQVTQVEMEQ